MSEACPAQQGTAPVRDPLSIETSEILPPEQAQPFSEERLSEDLLAAFAELWTFVDERSQRVRKSIRMLAPSDPIAALSISEALSQYREDMLKSVNRQKNAFLRLMNLVDVVGDGAFDRYGEHSSISDPQNASKMSRSVPPSSRLVPAMKRILCTPSVVQRSFGESDFQQEPTPLLKRTEYA